jgi:hypothetical protein
MTIIQKSLAKVLFKNLASAVCICALFVLIGVSCQQASPEASDTQVSALARGAITAPTPIKDQAGLAAIDGAPDRDYVLANDIELDDWTLICESTAFTGTLDGAGHTITVNSFDSSALSGLRFGIFAQSAAYAAFWNLKLVFAQEPATLDSAQYAGGLVAYAEDTIFKTITVDGTFDVTFTGTLASSVSAPAPAKGADTFHALIIGAEPTDGFNVGSLVGYADKGSRFNEITANAAVNATSEQTAVFAGGVAGYTDTVSIASGWNTGTITGNGPGYNTSAGGIAGYIVNTTVSDSYSVGSIELTASGGTGWDDSWQADGGGLIGYAGGSAAGGSFITRSYATGSVNVTAPFPYAGGLVGYSYGFNNFEDPAGNGTIIAKSYAIGDVTAESVSSGEYGNIPYAGGLVGYSSIRGSQIEDSYATGIVLADTDGTYAWAGGIVGGNANDSIVTRTYATGSVYSQTGTLAPLYAPQYADPGPAAGGIAGFNYFTDMTILSYSVALNGKVDGRPVASPSVEHRVAGSIGNGTGYDGTLIENRGSTAMATTWTPVSNPNGEDGQDIAPPPSQSDYEGLGWDFNNVWDYNGGYPTLR